MKEATLQRHIIAYLRARGDYVFKVVGSAAQQQGTPDLLVCHGGLFVGVELKVPGQKPTPMQEHELAKIVKAGGQGMAITSMEEMQVLLQ